VSHALAGQRRPWTRDRLDRSMAPPAARTRALRTSSRVLLAGHGPATLVSNVSFSPRPRASRPDSSSAGTPSRCVHRRGARQAPTHSPFHLRRTLTPSHSPPRIAHFAGQRADHLALLHHADLLRAAAHRLRLIHHSQRTVRHRRTPKGESARRAPARVRST